jgi:hypothetical protein
MKREFTVTELLRQETERELASRSVHWQPFTQQVLRRIDGEARAQSQRGLEDQVLQTLREEVDAELTSRQPHFEGPFVEAVQSRIFKEGIGTRPQPTRWWRQLWLRPLVAATAVAAGWLFVVSGGGPVPGSEPQEVHIQKLSFDGSATVVAEEGLTVVWVQGPG